MGLQRELAGWAAVPQSDGVRSGVRVGRPQASSGDSHGLLCRDRRVVGTEQRVRGGCDGQDRVRSQSGERAGGHFFGHLGMSVTRIGLEAGPLSQWLHAGLSEAGFETGFCCKVCSGWLIG